MRVAERIGFALVALLCVVLFSRLGVWQYERGLGKQEQRAQQSAASQANVDLPLAQALATDAAPGTIRRVAGRGRFLTPLLLLDSQQRGGRVGLRVYGVATVLGAETTNRLLVDLGWLPMGPNRIVPMPPSPEGERDLRGLLVSWPGQGMRLAPNPWPSSLATPVLLNTLDGDEIARAFGVAMSPLVLRLAPELDYGFERDLEALPNTLPPERHFGYAVQWFGLAATVVVVYLVLSWRSRRRKSV